MNNNSKSIILFDSVSDYDDLDEIASKNKSKIISFNYDTHKILKDKKIYHEISDNYLSKKDLRTIQKTAYGILFLIIMIWGIQDLLVKVVPSRQARENYQKVQQFIKKLGPRDLILISNRQHIWFYLYGANEMRNRVQNILHQGKMDNVYFTPDYCYFPTLQNTVPS